MQSNILKNAYNFKKQVEYVNSIEKRLFCGINTIKSVKLQTKETKLKKIHITVMIYQ